MHESSFTGSEKMQTKSQELNQLLSWGITKGSIILLSGEPWIGKSTLALQLADWISGEIIYISWEENESQIIQRANRLGLKKDNISLLCENHLQTIMKTLSQSKSDFVVLDSISVITSDEATGSAGSISQVKAVAEAMVEFGKNSQTTIIMIGHVNKDGNLAWPKTLEHLVDTVLYFEWERYEDVRMLRSLKNRFGSTWEIALFLMTEQGLSDLSNPWLEFISKENDSHTSGSCLSITMEWSRAMVLEIESLSTYTKFGYPKRSARGLPIQKLDLILAVLSKYSKVNLDSFDVYLNIVRGLRVDEPWVDVSIGASIISGKLNQPLPRDHIFLGEISLTWRLKNCMHLEKRIKEAQKLWFKNCIIPDVEIKGDYQIALTKIKDISWLVGYISQMKDK